MTLKEIAKEANVSISTVSRVINQKNTKAASPEVQERIWEIVRLFFHPFSFFPCLRFWLANSLSYPKAASPEVQERIWEIVRKSGYTPNSTARALKMGPSIPVTEAAPKTIACIYARGCGRIGFVFLSYSKGYGAGSI